MNHHAPEFNNQSSFAKHNSLHQTSATTKTQTKSYFMPAKEIGLTVYTAKSPPFPPKIIYQHLNKNILSNKYKIQFTANKPKDEVKSLILTDKMKFEDDDLKQVDDSTFKKIRSGRDERSTPGKQTQKKHVKPWQQTN